MDFFASQDLARRNTRLLIFYFIVAVICMIAGIYFVVMLAFGGIQQANGGDAIAAANFFNPEVLAGVSLAVSSVVGCGSAYRIASLRGGGESVAAMLGGRVIPPSSRDVDERKILNVVEEMALAAGAPVPPVYILDNEQGINAFAAGYTIDDAVIGINRGTIQTLNRDELQGVIAHEFSHILNGDMRMSIRMIGVLHGIQLLSLIGFYVIRGMAYGGGRRSSSNSKEGKGGAVAIMLVAVGVIAIGWIGMFFARIIKASVSRQREFLADASAVQFTRNPEGIAGALKMIGASMQGSSIQSPAAEETSHMFFASMFKRNFFNMFATHPPLDQRILKLDPRFDGDYGAYARPRQEKELRRQKAEQKKQANEQTKHRIGFPGRDMVPGSVGDQFPIDPFILVAGIGLPDDDDVHYSEMIVDRIPEVLVESAHDVFSARCLVFATLLNPETDIRRSQLHAIAKSESQATIDETIRLMQPVDDMAARFRLPVFEILQGTLTGMSPEQYQAFHASVDRLVSADQKVDMFEFFLRHHLMVHLDRRFGRVPPPKLKYRAMNPLKDDVCTLLALVAKIGHEDHQEAVGAFAAAMDSLEKPDWNSESRLIENAFDHELLGRVIDRLNQASPTIKKRILTAMAVMITFDRQVTIEEAELFRAMSESLDCPVPPVVASNHRTDIETS